MNRISMSTTATDEHPIQPVSGLMADTRSIWSQEQSRMPQPLNVRTWTSSCIHKPFHSEIMLMIAVVSSRGKGQLIKSVEVSGVGEPKLDVAVWSISCP